MECMCVWSRVYEIVTSMNNPEFKCNVWFRLVRFPSVTVAPLLIVIE